VKTLVAAPAHSSKAYAFDRWAAATRPYPRLISVETDDYEMKALAEVHGVRWVEYEKIDYAKRIGLNAIYGPLFNDAWRAILSDCKGYSHILALDTDVIPTGDILKVMEEEYTDDIMFLRHGVPWRSSYGRASDMKAYETSCTLGKVEDWRVALRRTDELGGLSTLYGVVGHPTMYPARNIYVMELEHVDNGIDGRR
jgi:hypothetical protein